MPKSLLFAATLALALGCSNSHTAPPDRCDMTKVCLVTDSLGCCDGRGSEVSVCDACPGGTVERLECRTSGCDDPCTGTPSSDASGDSARIRPPDEDTDFAPAARCYEDMGSGCCGDEIFGGDVCGSCPAGSVEEWSCSNFAPECGCGGGITGIRPPGDEEPGAPDAGAPAPPDELPPLPPEECYADLGGGCCGAYVGAPTECGCPAGSVAQSTCGAYSAGTSPDGEVPPMPPGEDEPGFFAGCRSILVDGTCGDFAEPNVCGDCPADSVSEWECAVP